MKRAWALLLLSLVPLLGQDRTLDPQARAWVETTLSQLDLEQKIGQLIVAGTPTQFTNVASDRFQRIREDITRYHVGGYHAFHGTVFSAAVLIRRMQSLARVPLLITADLEGGAGLIFEGATRFPKAMAIGATDDPELAREVAGRTAREARRIGINVNFYPVVDVNNNPRNPIINIRSFGEDPQAVARMAVAYIEGTQQEGLLATAKHFPGHGDTETDSHLELPVVTASRERLQEVELVPFRAAIEAHVGAVMAAHLAVPALEKTPGLPATLSPAILKSLLRRDLGFDGLVFTDALGMGAIARHYSPEKVAVGAIQAGADILLYPPSVERAFRALRLALERGRISEERLNTSVRRILEAKARLGLFRRRETDLLSLDETVGSRQNQDASNRIMERAVTLVRDPAGWLPLKLKPAQQLLVLTLLDSERRNESRGERLLAELASRHPNLVHFEVHPETSRREIALMRELALRVDATVAAAFIRVAAYKGEIALSPGQIDLLKTLSALKRPLGFVLLGSPYLLESVPELPTCVLTYDDYPGAEAAAVRALWGEIHFQGHLPVTLPDLYPIGHGIER